MTLHRNFFDNLRLEILKKNVELPEHFSKVVSSEKPELRSTATAQGTLTTVAIMEKTKEHLVLASKNQQR